MTVCWSHGLWETSWAFRWPKWRMHCTLNIFSANIALTLQKGGFSVNSSTLSKKGFVHIALDIDSDFWFCLFDSFLLCELCSAASNQAVPCSRWFNCACPRILAPKLWNYMCRLGDNTTGYCIVSLLCKLGKSWKKLVTISTYFTVHLLSPFGN